MFNNHTWKPQVSAWLGVSAAVCTAIAFTQSAWCLIALIIPLMVSDGKEKKED